MSNYRLVIQYDGGRYRGWQRLGNEENTIQGKLESSLSALVGSPIEVIGCSRTDAGVHALAQIANFHTDRVLFVPEIRRHLNEHLPRDISVTDVTPVPDNFHARYQAKSKVYLYRIWNEPYPNPFMRRYSMHVQQKLDVARMQEAAHHFLGSHDFTAFSNAKSKKKSMVREIDAIEVTRTEGFVQIRVRGKSFLYNMVRKMVGALISVGLEELSAESIPQLLASRERGQIGAMADACGLYLEEVVF